MKMKNSTYDTLKKIQFYILPGLATLYTGLAQIWELPYAEQIAGTCALVATFLGICLKVSSDNYWDELESDTDDSEEVEE